MDASRHKQLPSPFRHFHLVIFFLFCQFTLAHGHVVVDSPLHPPRPLAHWHAILVAIFSLFFQFISTIFNLFYFISTKLILWIGCNKCCTGFKFHTCIHLCSINLQNIQHISIYFNYFQYIFLHFN